MGTIAKVQARLNCGVWISGGTVERNVSRENLRLLAGMIEAGEITFANLKQVGGDELVLAVYKLVDHTAIGTK